MVEDEFSPGQVNELSSKIVQMSAGDSHTAALDDQGRVYCWGIFRVSCLRVWLSVNYTLCYLLFP